MEGKADESNDGSEYTVNKVSIKIPPFWPEKPDIWFYQVEAQFAINKITSEQTQFNYIIAQLEPKYVENIWDIITGSEVNKYSIAKQRLLDIFKESEDKKIKRLLTGIELGDYKPSQLLRKMKSLAGKDVSDKVLRTLWLEKLPDSIKNILIVSEECLDRVALMADKILEMNPNSDLCNTVDQTPKGASFDELITKISQLEHQIAALQVGQCNNRSRSPYRGSRTHTRSRSSSRRRQRFDPNGKYCYYHFRFRERCIPDKCKQPCSWTASENSNRQSN